MVLSQILPTNNHFIFHLASQGEVKPYLLSQTTSSNPEKVALVVQVTASGPDNCWYSRTHRIGTTVPLDTGIFNSVAFSIFLFIQSASNILHSEDVNTLEQY